MPQAFRYSLRDCYHAAGATQEDFVDSSQREERVSREHEMTARSEPYGECGKVVIPGRVRVYYLNTVCTDETGEACHVLRVVATAQRQHRIVGQERQFGPERRAGNRCCVHFVAEINEGVRKIC